LNVQRTSLRPASTTYARRIGRVLAVSVEVALVLTPALRPNLNAGGAVVMISSIDAITVLRARGLTMAAYSSGNAASGSLVRGGIRYRPDADGRRGVTLGRGPPMG
jgi:hypothetical protein